MRKLPLILLFCNISGLLFSQAKFRSHWISLESENDAYNLLAAPADWGITNRFGLGWFHAHTNKSITGWQLEQWMVTPKLTRPAIPDRNDYPYSGALILSHTRARLQPEKKIQWQYSFRAGLLGPPALAKQTQQWLHRVISDPPPNGWDYQLPTDLLLNGSIVIQRMVVKHGLFSAFATAHASVGTYKDEIGVGTQLQLGSLPAMAPFLPGSRFAQNKKTGWRIRHEIALDYIPFDALLEGGLFNRRSPVRTGNTNYGSVRVPERIKLQTAVAVEWANRWVAVSYRQHFGAADYRGYERPRRGTVSLCFAY